MNIYRKRFMKYVPHYLQNGIVILLLVLLLSSLLMAPLSVNAEAQKTASLSLVPIKGGFAVGSIFEVSIFINTGGERVGEVYIDLLFPADIVQFVSPSSERSLIDTWFSQPNYSNHDGWVHLGGGFQGPGLKTNAGLITTVTFRSIASGEAIIEFASTSRIIAVNPEKTDILSFSKQATFTIVPVTSPGPIVFSETHPGPEVKWYRNPNPIVGWQGNDADGFSYELNTDPLAVPDNIVDTDINQIGFENLGDGIHYFHLRSKKQDVWSPPTHFAIRIDTRPPLSFEPKVEYISAAILYRAMIHFSTKDTLSGMDHYELAFFEASENIESPIFIAVHSPYQLSEISQKPTKVLVRAVDRAGNIREASITVLPPPSFFFFVKQNVVLLVIIFSAFLFIILHFFIGHHLIRVIRRNVRRSAKVLKPETQNREKLDGDNNSK